MNPVLPSARLAATRRGNPRSNLLRKAFAASAVAVAVDCLASPAYAEDLPMPISCYQEGSNSKNIDAYMSCFTEDAEMIDLSRTFRGKEKIRAWALREVISNGDTFKHRKILEQDEGYAKTEVNWLSWCPCENPLYTA